MAMPANNEAPYFAFAHYFIGWAKIVHDLKSLRRAAHDAGKLGNTAIVFAHVDFRNLGAGALLAATVSRAKHEAGLSFLFGTELEFIFLQSHTLTAPPDQGLGLHNNAILSRSQYWLILD